MARLLRPGGLILLIEPDLVPRIDGRTASDGSGDSDLHGWLTFWETYRACLRSREIDTTVPLRLVDILAATQAFENIVTRDCDIPVGFWPSGKCFAPPPPLEFPSTQACECRSAFAHYGSVTVDGL